MTSYALRSANPAKSKADVVVVGVVQVGDGPDQGVELAPGAEAVAGAYGKKLLPLLATLDVKGGAGEITRLPSAGVLSSPLLVLVGLGKEITPGGVRRGAGAAARAVSNAASVAIALPADSPELVRAATEGWLLGGYTFTTYKKKGESDPAPADVVFLSPGARRKEVAAAFGEAQVVAAAVAGTRDWVNVPAADLTPPEFADRVVEAGKAQSKGPGGKVTITVADEKRLAELGCGGILGVGASSAAPPRLVELRYQPRRAALHLALVGKGVTFDSGGLTIKPGQGMNEMKSDMAGAAAVVQATFAIAALGLPIRVTTFAPMAENMVSGSAMRPGDVLTLRGGTTVEISNTDAEGRLLLGDALALAAEAEPDLVVDVATLTGHMVVALGDKVAGVMGSDDVVADVLAAALVAGEECWPMPIPEGMDARIHSSKIADLAQHDWVRWGGGLFAAAFLREFTGGLPWAHLDIAGPGFASGGPSGHLTPGGTGFGVTTLVELARTLSER